MDINHSADDNILLAIQNNAKPDRVVYLVFDKPTGLFRTKGLKDLFRVKEIRIEAGEVVDSLPEYAQVLSFLVETMSAAEDFGLPYTYQDEFEYEGTKFSLHEEGEYRILRRIEAQSSSI
jgi:hypothetical protein